MCLELRQTSKQACRRLLLAYFRNWRRASRIASRTGGVLAFVAADPGGPANDWGAAKAAFQNELDHSLQGDMSLLWDIHHCAAAKKQLVRPWGRPMQLSA